MVSAALYFLLFAANVEPQFGLTKVFEDWIVGCDNWLSCRATSLPAEDDGQSEPYGDGNLQISIDRDYGARAAVEIRLRLVGDASLKDHHGSLKVTIDGKRLNLPVQIEGDEIHFDRKSAAKLITHLRRGRWAGLVDAKGIELASASLGGIYQSLVEMDDNQRRTGTVGALAEPGKRPSDSFTVPPMPPRPPVWRAAQSNHAPRMVPDAVLDTWRATDICDEGGVTEPKSTASFYRLDAATSLVVLETKCQGYNPMSRLFVIAENGVAKPAPFGPHPFADDEPEVYLPNVWWDAKARILSAGGKARGLGDCGDLVDYAWDGRQFRTVLFRTMPVCRGSYDYITTYRLDVLTTETP